MPATTPLEAIRALVTRHGQEHLLQFYEELPPEERGILLGEIAAVDFPLMDSLHRDLASTETTEATDPVRAAKEDIRPLRARSWDDFSVDEQAVMANHGMRALREGKAAAFLVAGGQGTRLGHAGPKGVFDIGLPSRKSLFQLQAERLLNLSRRAGRAVPWYIMTSRENHSDTCAYFRRRRFFGLREDDVFFFPQDELPVTDMDGKILLAARGRLSLGPNGNGGCFPALARSGSLEDMKRRGVEWVFLYGVDNALIRVCDPRFIGFAMASGLPAASKAVAKAGAEEKAGVLCLRGGKPSVLEYSEMTAADAQARDAGGNLIFGSANIATHLFAREFLETHASAALPYHLARKKIPWVNAQGRLVVPEEPNALKFELFMFDLFPKAPGMAALLVNREEEFAPVKNREGSDSPASARALILSLHHRWALQAGLTEAELRDKTVEISPLTSYAGEGLDPSAIRARSHLGESVVLVE